MLSLVVAIVVMLIGSALCSSSEAAILSVPVLKTQQLAESKKPAALALLAIRQRVNRPIATIVILNNLLNIVGSVLIGGMAATVFHDALLGIFTAILTLLVILFGEIFPKIFGERYAVPIALAVAIPIRWITWLFTPIVLLLERVTAPFVNSGNRPSTNEAEIKLMATIGHEEGIIEADEDIDQSSKVTIAAHVDRFSALLIGPLEQLIACLGVLYLQDVGDQPSQRPIVELVGHLGLNCSAVLDPKPLLDIPIDVVDLLPTIRQSRTPDPDKCLARVLSWGDHNLAQSPNTVLGLLVDLAGVDVLVVLGKHPETTRDLWWVGEPCARRR